LKIPASRQMATRSSFGLREIYFAREVEMVLDTEGATVELGCADFEQLDELLVEIGEA
jgi:hypothetical protein